MGNRTSIIVGIVIVLAIIGDYSMNDAQGLLFLGKKMLALLDWMTFWR
ncbi:glyceraldehyde-3-phosphate dehydrogenase [Amylibacter kogurei]|uniref:Glyceraldehyde-3-phosphate dehydrogenase n=1 Tax=Paramylibacter kogurei TaxID=1889778 RepID=A0A2G5K699_9RHOB|nr:glyceraldehyde-3-phosphate dehydrogenase [Amylibacter kogurei]